MKYRFFLDFLDYPQFGRIETTEWGKYDGSTWTVERSKDNWGLDVRFANEEVSIEIYDCYGFYDKLEAPQQLPTGEIINYATMGFPWMLIGFKEKGFELRVNAIVELDGVEFTIGQALIVDTDMRTFFACKFIEATKIAQIRRDEETSVDVLSDTDIKGNTIAPLQPVNYLLKAKPVTQISTWKSRNDFGFGGASIIGTGGGYDINQVGVNNSNIPILYGIDRSLSFISNAYALSTSSEDVFVPNDGLNFTYVDFTEEATNVTVNLTEIDAYSRAVDTPAPPGEDYEITQIDARVRMVIVVASDISNPRLVLTPYTRTITSVTGAPIEYLPTELEVEIPLVFRGERMYIYIESAITNVEIEGDVPNGLIIYSVPVRMDNMKVEISATLTGIDTVIKAVRYIDLAKQCVKSINGMTLTAPTHDAGGEMYDQFATTGKLMKRQVDKPFYVNYKDLMSDFYNEVCHGNQITPETIYLGSYEQFRPNRELIALTEAPSANFRVEFDPDKSRNTVNAKFQTYERDKDEKNTTDAVHTESQDRLPNEQVKGALELNIKHIRDYAKIESMRKLTSATGRQTTAFDTDDSIVVIDSVQLPPGTQTSFSAYLLQRTTDNPFVLQILNQSLEDTETGESVFGWDTIGLTQGQSIFLSGGENAGGYNVANIEPAVLTITGANANFSGAEVITITFTYTGVQYTNRTSEGFTVIENVSNKSANLLYTLSRIKYDHWGSFINSMCDFSPEESIIRNTKFISNGEARTQFGSQPLYQENQNTPLSELPEKLVTPFIYKTKVVASFNQVVQLWNDINTIDTDGIGGFIRIANAWGGQDQIYPNRMSYIPVEGTLMIEGEQRFQQEKLDINTLADNVIEINSVPYPIQILSGDWYRATGDRIVLYDNSDMAMTESYDYSKVRVNGVSYESVEEVLSALNGI